MDKKFILNLFLGLAGLAILVPVATMAQVTVKNPIGYNTFPELFKAIANGVIALIGGLATIMLIYTGILFLFSAGSPEKINKAKVALTYAIIGIAVAAAATAIVAWIQGIIGA